VRAVRKIVATYDYTDADCKIMFQVVRYEPKTFSQRRPDGKGGWINDVKGVTLVPYHLPEILKSSTVYIVEGERDVESLRNLGLTATTNPGGAGKWKIEYSQYFKGKIVIIIPDNDMPGKNHARQVAQALKGIAEDVVVLKLPEAVKDVTDWLSSGANIADLDKLPRLELSEPSLIIGAGVYDFTWDSFTARLCRVREQKDGRMTAEIKIMTSLPGYEPVLEQTSLNLLSSQARKKLAETLESKCSVENWSKVLDSICQKSIEAFRKGEPVVEIWTCEEAEPPKCLLAPILAEGEPNFIYGPGGSGKSYFALLLGICLQLPWPENPFGFYVQDRTADILYLDWETAADEIRWRTKCLVMGLDLPDFFIKYHRCTMPLADDIESISQKVAETHTRCIIIDSLAAACGGDLNMPEPALRFFRALRSLNVTSLIIAHTPRESMGEKQIFGSVFFWNYGRSIWELKPETEVGSDSLLFGLFHRKANMSKLHEPMGFRLKFENGATYVERVDSQLRHSSLSGHLPLADQIESFLEQHEPMTAREIAQELSKGEDSIRKTLNRHKGSRFEKLGEKWDILTRHPDRTGREYKYSLPVLSR
jgi:5S rRNA maturation endonuclease (ribonuclease M5)